MSYGREKDGVLIETYTSGWFEIAIKYSEEEYLTIIKGDKYYYFDKEDLDYMYDNSTTDDQFVEFVSEKFKEQIAKGKSLKEQIAFFHQTNPDNVSDITFQEDTTTLFDSVTASINGKVKDCGYLHYYKQSSSEFEEYCGVVRALNDSDFDDVSKIDNRVFGKDIYEDNYGVKFIQYSNEDYEKLDEKLDEIINEVSVDIASQNSLPYYVIQLDDDFEEKLGIESFYIPVNKMEQHVDFNKIKTYAQNNNLINLSVSKSRENSAEGVYGTIVIKGTYDEIKEAVENCYEYAKTYINKNSSSEIEHKIEDFLKLPKKTFIETLQSTQKEWDKISDIIIKEKETELNKKLEPFGLLVSIYMTDDIYDEDGVYYEQEMFEARVKTKEDDDYNNMFTGRYCSLESVIDEIEQYVETAIDEQTQKNNVLSYADKNNRADTDGELEFK